MKNIAFAIIIALTAAQGCGSFGKVAWPSVVTCAGVVAAEAFDAVKAILQADNLLDGLSADSEAKLEALAVKYGPELVVCLVSRAIDEWMGPDKPAASQEQSQAAKRGQDWLNRHEITVRE